MKYLRIGDFSNIVGISVKTIRFYEEKGLIKPAYIDKYTGYRYYDEKNIEQILMILQYKNMGFTLEEIKNISVIKTRKKKLEEFISKELPVKIKIASTAKIGNIKKNIVQKLVDKTLKNKLQVQKTVGMENPFHYRNKAQYPLGINKDGNPVIGVFANRTHEVIEIKECMIQNKESEKIAKYICEFAKKNNEAFGYERFDYLYLEDSLPDNDRIILTHKKIKEFFEERRK